MNFELTKLEGIFSPHFRHVPCVLGGNIFNEINALCYRSPYLAQSQKDKYVFWKQS